MFCPRYYCIHLSIENTRISNENSKTIHGFEFNLICNCFSHENRQGPVSPEVTLKAFNFIDNQLLQTHVADLGCKTG